MKANGLVSQSACGAGSGSRSGLPTDVKAPDVRYPSGTRLPIPSAPTTAPCSEHVLISAAAVAAFRSPAGSLRSVPVYSSPSCLVAPAPVAVRQRPLQQARPAAMAPASALSVVSTPLLSSRNTTVSQLSPLVSRIGVRWPADRSQVSMISPSLLAAVRTATAYQKRKTTSKQSARVSLLPSPARLPVINCVTAFTPRQQQPTTCSPRQQQPEAFTPRQQQPTAFSPRQQQPEAFTPQRQQPTVLTPRRQQPTAFTPRQQQPAMFTPRQQQPAMFTPRQQQPAVFTPRQQQPAVFTPRQQQTAVFTPRQQQPAAFTPRLQQPAVFTPRQQQPAAFTPRQQQSAVLSPLQQQSAVLSPLQQQSAVLSPLQQQSAVLSPRQQQSAAFARLTVPMFTICNSSLPVQVAAQSDSDTQSVSHAVTVADSRSRPVQLGIGPRSPLAVPIVGTVLRRDQLSASALSTLSAAYRSQSAVSGSLLRSPRSSVLLAPQLRLGVAGQQLPNQTVRIAVLDGCSKLHLKTLPTATAIAACVVSASQASPNNKAQVCFSSPDTTTYTTASPLRLVPVSYLPSSTGPHGSTAAVRLPLLNTESQQLQPSVLQQPTHKYVGKPVKARAKTRRVVGKTATSPMTSASVVGESDMKYQRLKKKTTPPSAVVTTLKRKHKQAVKPSKRTRLTTDAPVATETSPLANRGDPDTQFRENKAFKLSLPASMPVIPTRPTPQPVIPSRPTPQSGKSSRPTPQPVTQSRPMLQSVNLSLSTALSVNPALPASLRLYQRAMLARLDLYRPVLPVEHALADCSSDDEAGIIGDAAQAAGDHRLIHRLSSCRRLLLAELRRRVGPTEAAQLFRRLTAINCAHLPQMRRQQLIGAHQLQIRQLVTEMQQLRERQRLTLQSRQSAQLLALAAAECPASTADLLQDPISLSTSRAAAGKSSSGGGSSRLRKYLCCHSKNGQPCRRVALPCTRHCSLHILYNVDQLLFQHCTAKFADNSQCSVPVFDVKHELPLCSEHARKRDNYEKMVEKTKSEPKKKSRSIKKPKRRKRVRRKSRSRDFNSLEQSQQSNHDGSNAGDVSAAMGADCGDVEATVCRQLEAGLSSCESRPDHELLDRSLELQLAAGASKFLENEFSEVLSKLPDEAFTDLFSDAHGDDLGHKETEELERALEAVERESEVSPSKLQFLQPAPIAPSQPSAPPTVAVASPVRPPSFSSADVEATVYSQLAQGVSLETAISSVLNGQELSTLNQLLTHLGAAGRLADPAASPAAAAPESAAEAGDS